jgi:hypothetical protein
MHHVSTVKTNHRETNAVYCENHTKHINTLCGQGADFYYVKVGGTYRTTGLQRVKNVLITMKITIKFSSK